MAETKIIRPQPGYQEKFVRTSVDFCVGGGVLASGKTFASVLAIAQLSLEPNFTALYLRNNLGDAKAGGGIMDTFREIFGKSIKIVESGDPHIDFPNGGRVDISHVANQSKDTIMQRFKGRQYDLIVFDEGTGFSWETFTTIFTRRRGHSKWSGHVLMTTNPERDHWLRKFLDWYIGADGFIRDDRNGVVRYFYVNGESVNDVVWGGSKEEVYNLCRADINRKLSKMNKDGDDFFSWEDLIMSFTFYLGSMSENKAMIAGNSSYAGAVAMAGGRTAQQLLEGNWNVSTKGELENPISFDKADFVFENDPQINGDRWITCDLADVGTDNFIALVWDGFHVMDALIVSKSTPRQNADNLKMLAERYGIADNHIIFDAIGGAYIKDYIEDAQAFISYRQPFGIGSRGVLKLKDECYMRLVDVINRGNLSFSSNVANKVYTHELLKESILVRNEFIEECMVVRFRDAQSGKKTLITKKEMRNMLGKHRSTDLLDPCAMRMLPVLNIIPGEELAQTSIIGKEDDKISDHDRRYINVYNDSEWF